MADSDNSNIGMFIPTTNVWDVDQIRELSIDSDEFKEFIVRMYQNINNIAVVLNAKDSGYYPDTEFINGKLYFPNPLSNQNTNEGSSYRPDYRMSIVFGPLPNATTISIPHNIQISTTLPSTYSLTNIYGAATKPDQTGFIPLPYSSPTLNKNIELYATATDVVITTAIDYSAYTIVIITLEYLKN